MWEIRIQHAGLNAFRLVKGVTREDAELKAQLQSSVWDERWARQQKVRANQIQRENRAISIVENKALAASLTSEAKERIASVENLLRVSLGRGRYFDWDVLKDRTAFSHALIPKAEIISPPPRPEESTFKPILTFLDKIFPSRRIKKEAESQAAFEAEFAKWQEKYEYIENLNSAARANEAKLAAEVAQAKILHGIKMASQHAAIEGTKIAFTERNPSEVEYFFSEVLARSTYPETFPDERSLQYDPLTSSLVVDYELPNVSAFPTHREVKFIASRNELQEVPVTETWLKKVYDDALYQITLRTIHEIFEHDSLQFVKAVCFNGWVRSIDKATGAEVHGCILSIQVGVDELAPINLEQVDPKTCFRKLKGVASSKLIELQPIRPVISISRDDDRFVNPYAVLGTVDDRTNLASMDWLDFENLIREVFEKEFSKNGGEVKITQASRDGGVDAVAFDPDPLRGGKIVIQAKRYTNVVGVSAVRDLYGTVHNEGATKGILVTTSTYGPDAYEFAKGKPLTLLSGSELLYLLEQHGKKAKIDPAQARMEYRESQKS